jgi:hypothetical protein
VDSHSSVQPKAKIVLLKAKNSAETGFVKKLKLTDKPVAIHFFGKR